MLTKGSGIAAVLYVVLLVTAVRSVQPPGDDRLSRRRGFPVATAAALPVVGIPTLFQLTVAHGLLDHLERDRVAIGRGQLWRLVTSLVVQDSGWSGAVVNLVFLVMVGTAAERAWGAWRWLVLAVASGVGAQLWGLLVQPVGAGNSVVNFGLAASWPCWLRVAQTPAGSWP